MIYNSWKYKHFTLQLSFLSDLLCCQCELLPRAAPLRQAGVRVRDARAGAAHLRL